MKKLNELELTKGTCFKAFVKSAYGEKYDKEVTYEVTAIKNYKRGQKIGVRDTYLNINGGIWVAEYPHKVESVK